MPYRIIRSNLEDLDGQRGSVRAERWDTNGNLLMTTTTPYAESNGNFLINFGTNDVFDLMYTNKQKAAFLYMVPGANNMITTNGPITNEPTLALPPKQ